MAELPERDEEKGAADLLVRAHAAASPSPDDRARIRARLSSALALGAAGTAGAVATKKGLGALASFGSMPLAAKIGLSMFVVGVATTATVMRLERAGDAPSPANTAMQASVASMQSTRAMPSPLATVASSAPSDERPEAPGNADGTSVRVIASSGVAPSIQGPLTHSTMSTAPAHLSSGPSDGHVAPVAPAVPATSSTAEPGLATSAASSTAATQVAPPGRDPMEVALLGRMTQSLARGDAATTLSLANEHERAYPKSVFSEEREGARAVARCMTQPADAQKQATRDAFLARFPHSPMRARVLATCGATSTNSAANGGAP